MFKDYKKALPKTSKAQNAKGWKKGSRSKNNLSINFPFVFNIPMNFFTQTIAFKKTQNVF